MGNRWLFFFLLIVSLISCADDGGGVAEVVSPTALMTAAPLATLTSTPVPPPATNTPLPTDTPSPTETAVSTSTPRPPTETPFIPTKTAMPTATFTPTSSPTAVPPTPFPSEFPTTQPTSSVPLTGANILPNGSFEGGHYNQWGVPEFQLPNGWWLEFDEGPTGYGNESWDVWVRPETRVLPDYQLPPAEHGLFIYDGTHTVKIFKGYGAISIRLLTDVYLPAGTYRMTINIYPDLYTSYEGGQKIWASDPASGEVRFVVSGGSGGSGWRRPAFGQRNTMIHEFTINEAQSVAVGVGIKGPFAIANNGWVMDAWSLQQISN